MSSAKSEKELEKIWQEIAGPTGPLDGPRGCDSTYNTSAPGANGPAGPFGTALPKERPEIELRNALRRCHAEGVPYSRIVEIFDAECVKAVHDD